MPAEAQEKNTLAVGGSYTFRAGLDSAARSEDGIGLDWRFGHGTRGWGWDFGFGWFSADIDRNIAGRTVELGELKVRPILVGYGYTATLTKKLAVKMSLKGGFAFTSFGLTAEARDALRAPGGGSIEAESSFIPALKPEAGLWYDLNDKWGLGASLGYTLARPSLMITTAAGADSRRINADTLSISAGLVYRIF